MRVKAPRLRQPVSQSVLAICSSCWLAWRNFSWPRVRKNTIGPPSISGVTMETTRPCTLIPDENISMMTLVMTIDRTTETAVKMPEMR
ncbi:hypothetical protein D9M68_806620 [compost metagenome]